MEEKDAKNKIIRELERNYVKKCLREYWSNEVVDLTEIEITDEGVAIHWKAEVSDEIRYKYLEDVEDELSTCWSCESILEDALKKLLNGGEVKLDEESIGLCKDYWEWLLEKILKKQV